MTDWTIDDLARVADAVERVTRDHPRHITLTFTGTSRQYTKWRTRISQGATRVELANKIPVRFVHTPRKPWRFWQRPDVQAIIVRQGALNLTMWGLRQENERAANHNGHQRADSSTGY